MHPLRTLLLLVALGALAVPRLHAQQPFEVVPPTGKPWTVVFTAGTLNQNAIPSGAWIGLFDGERAVGAARFEGAFPLSITAWQADAGTGLAGFTPGNPISVRLHTAYFDTTFTLNASVAWAQGSGTFGTGAFGVGVIQATSNRVPVASLTSAAPLDFGRVVVGQSSSRSLELRNSGRARLRVLSVQPSNSVFAPSLSQAEISAGGRLTVNVTFQPNAAMPFTGTPQIVTDDPVQPIWTVSALGQGLPARVAAFELEPSSLNFGWVPVDSVAAQDIRLRSTGTDTLRVSGLQIAGPAFEATASRLVIPPGQTATLRISYRPRQESGDAATLSILSNAPQGMVPVSGTGYRPFYPLPVSSGKPYTVVFSKLAVDRLALQAGDELALLAGDRIVGAGVFAGSVPFSVTAWQRQTEPALPGFVPGEAIRARARTERFGARADVALDSLVFTSGDGRFGTGPFTVVEASGYSGRAPSRRVSASALEFGSITVQATATQAVMLYNDGQTDLQANLSIDAPFQIVGSASRVVRPQDSVRVEVRLVPTSIGTFAGTLRVASNDPFRGPAEVRLTARSIIAVPTSPVQFEMEPVAILSVPTGSPIAFETRLFNPFAQAISGTVSYRSTSGRLTLSTGQGAITLQAVSRYQESISVVGMEAGRDTLEVVFQASGQPEVVFRQPVWVHTSLFSTVAPTGRPFTVVVSGVQTQGLPLAFGDEVALMDGPLVVGTGLYTGPQAPVVITAWEEDPAQGVPGFRRGQPMTFRIAKRARGYDERLALHTRATTFSGTGRFGEGAFQQATLTVDEPPFWLNRLSSQRVLMDAFTSRVWSRLDTVVVDPDLGALAINVRTDTSGLRASVANNRLLFDLTPGFHGFVNVYLDVTQGPYTLRDSIQIHVVKPPRLVVDDLFRAPFVWTDRVTRELRWEAERALEPPTYVLEYTPNNGARWDTLYVGTEAAFSWSPPVQTLNEANQFRLTVTDLMGNRDVVRSAVPFTLASPRQSRLWQAGWHLAGAPFSAVDEGRSQPARGYRYRWVGDDYEEVTTYTPMEAHWLGLPSPSSDSLIGTVSEQATRVRLAQGWHPVTTGLLRTVYADSVRVHRSGQTPVTLRQAVAQGLIVAPVVFREGTYEAATDLVPFSGFWLGVQHPEGVEVEFPIHRYRTSGLQVQEDEPEMMLAFTVVASEQAHRLTLGTAPVLVPPPAPHGSRAGWRGPETALGSLYLSKALPTEEESVALEVSPASGTARISWEAHPATDRAWVLHLPDGRTFTLDTPGSAEWTVEDGSPTVQVGTASTSSEDALLPATLTLGQAYPNPGVGQTFIPYGLPAPTEIRLEVFSLLGQRMMVLVEGGFPAGYHQAVVPVRALPSGMYIYRLTTPEQTLQGTFLRVE